MATTPPAGDHIQFIRGTLANLGFVAGDGEPIFTTDQFRLHVCQSGVRRLMSVLLKIDATTAPTASNDASQGYSPGSLWVDTTSAKSYVCISSASGAAVWKQTGGDGAGSAPGAASTAVVQASHGLAVGNVVRHNGTAYVKAQADSQANAAAVGIVTAVADTNNFTLTTAGMVTGLSSLTAGTTYYLSPAFAGALTATEPYAAGQVSKPLLVATSATAGVWINQRGTVVS